MRTLGPIAAALALLAAGCAGPGRVTPVPAALPGPAQAGRSEAALPDRITLPAAYRLMLLDGRLTLVRESDPEALDRAPESLRIIAGEVARGELAYQPGLLPQELAAEVAANRESSARMDNALADVMARSRELSERALELQEQSRRLSDALTAEQARVAELEARAPAEVRPAAPAPGVRGDN